MSAAPEARGLAIVATSMHGCGMKMVIPVTKSGRLTLPPALRRTLGLDKVRKPALIAEERAGVLFLRPALPTRGIPKKQIKAWLTRDEAEMAAFRAKTSRTKADVAVPASHRVELDRRLKRLGKAPEPGRPWPDVHRELLARGSLGEQLSDLRGALRTRQAVKTLRKFGRNRE